VLAGRLLGNRGREVQLFQEQSSPVISTDEFGFTPARMDPSCGKRTYWVNIKPYQVRRLLADYLVAAVYGSHTV